MISDWSARQASIKPRRFDAVKLPLKPVKPLIVTRRFAVQSANGDAAERR
jgi:hypothetical protein